MKITKSKLDELHKYVQETDDIGKKEIAEYVEGDATPWVSALKQAYPDIYGDPEPTVTKYFLVENGIKKELTFMANKNGDVILEKIEPKELVTIKLKGKDVVIDLLKLVPIDDVSVSQLRILGDLAK